MSCFDTWQFVALKMTSITEEFQCFLWFIHTQRLNLYLIPTGWGLDTINRLWHVVWINKLMSFLVSFPFLYLSVNFFFCALTWKGTVFQYLVSTFPFLGLLHSPHTPMPKSSCFNPRNVLNFFFFSFVWLSTFCCFLFPFFHSSK